MEQPFAALDGVTDVVSGYTGGTVEDPTYKQVSAGRTGHKEAVQVTYDPARVSYQKLLDVFWRNVDSFDAVGQFCDRGEQYGTAVYVVQPLPTFHRRFASGHATYAAPQHSDGPAPPRLSRC